MTIDEAIHYLTLDLKSCPKGTNPIYLASHKLGIEALKRIKECRLADYMIAEDYLPGETKE